MKSIPTFNKQKKGLECLNCGQPLHRNDNFCSECGQKNINRISISELISNFFSGFFAFDNQFFRTLKPLLFKPGKVAKDYTTGLRKRYTNPFVFLLHTIILYFIINGVLNLFSIDKRYELLKEKQDYISQQKINDFFSKKGQITFFKDSLNSKLEKEKKLKDLIHNINEKDVKDSIRMNKFIITINTSPKHDIVKKIDKKFYDLNISYRISISNKDSVMLYIDEPIAYDTIYSKRKRMIKYAKNFPYKPTYIALNDLNIEPSIINTIFYKNTRKIVKFSILTDEKLFEKSFMSKVPMGLFILLPLLTLGFSLLYFRHTYKYTEHLIFVFYLQATFFWLVLVFSVIDLTFTNIFSGNKLVSPLINLTSGFLFLIIIYKSLKYFYQQSFIKTLFKLILLSFFYLLFGILGASFIATIAVLV